VPRYRDVWVTCTAIVATVGVCIAFLTWEVAGVVGAFIAGAVMGGAMTAALAAENLPRPWRRAALGAATAGVGVVAVAGLVVVLRAGVLVVLLAAALSSPPLVAVLRGRFGAKAPEAPTVRMEQSPTERPLDDLDESDWPGPNPVPVEPPLPMAPEDLDDDALCWAWRRSYVVLQRSSSESTRLHVVEVRQAYLDELERRNAMGLTAWLASGARAAGNPSRFIQGHPSSHANGSHANGSHANGSHANGTGANGNQANGGD
jgi:MFS family permease